MMLITFQIPYQQLAGILSRIYFVKANKLKARINRLLNSLKKQYFHRLSRITTLSFKTVNQHYIETTLSAITSIPRKAQQTQLQT